jgi:hypothetical protein
MEGMLSGSPLLFLDLRDRPIITDAQDRATLIRGAKEQYDEACDKLLKLEVPRAEIYDSMTVAYFHEVLFGDGDVRTTEHSHKTRNTGKQCPLYEAIENAQEGRGATHIGKLPPATVQQVSETANWIANRFFKDAWTVLPEKDKQRAEKVWGHRNFEALYRKNINAMSAQIRTIITSRNFHHLNLHDYDGGAGKLVGELVKLDRLPNETSLQGLLLLRHAWCEHDVAVYLASKYKLRSKFVFFTQLLVSWVIVLVGASNMDCGLSENKFVATALRHTLFGLATFVTLLSGFDSILNAKNRWHQLRSCACSLESIIWFYRARVGRFQQSVTESARPEVELCEWMNAWRDELVSSADLQTTDLERKHSSEILKSRALNTNIVTFITENIVTFINFSSWDVYKHQQFVGKGVKQLRAEKEAIMDQVCVCV